MDASVPQKEAPILSGKNTPLPVSDVDHLFLYHRQNKEVPFRPKGGEIYVYKPNDPAQQRDWVADGHMFSCEGTRKLRGRTGQIRKKYYYLLLKTEGKKRTTDKRFRKEVYESLCPELSGITILHYLGDSSFSIPRAHGNCLRQAKISIRTKPSVLKKIEESVREADDKAGHKI